MLTQRNTLLGMTGFVAGRGAVIETGTVASGRLDICISFMTGAVSDLLTLVLPYLSTSEHRNVATDSQIELRPRPLPVDRPVTLTGAVELRTDSNWPLFAYSSRETNDPPPPVAVAAISRRDNDTTRRVHETLDSGLTVLTTIDQPRNAVRVLNGSIFPIATRVTTAAAEDPFGETVQTHAYPNPPPASSF